MKRFCVCISFALLLQTSPCPAGEPAAEQNKERPAIADEKLRQELLDRMEKDQAIRREVMKQNPGLTEVVKMAQVDHENTKWLKSVY